MSDTPEQAPPNPEPNAVLVKVTYQEDGDVGVAVARLGDVRITEVPIILEQAAALARQQLGL